MKEVLLLLWPGKNLCSHFWHWLGVCLQIECLESRHLRNETVPAIHFGKQWAGPRVPVSVWLKYLPWCCCTVPEKKALWACTTQLWWTQETKLEITVLTHVAIRRLGVRVQATGLAGCRPCVRFLSFQLFKPAEHAAVYLLISKGRLMC